MCLPGCRFWEDAAGSVNANQTLILSEATQQVEKQNPPAMGRPACAVVAQVMNTGRAALSSGCCGARAYLDNRHRRHGRLCSSRRQAGTLRSTYRRHWQKRTRCSQYFTKFGGAILQLGRRQPLRVRWQRSKLRTRKFGLRELASRHLNGAPKAYEQLSIVAYVALPVEPGVPATARRRLQN